MVTEPMQGKSYRLRIPPSRTCWAEAQTPPAVGLSVLSIDRCTHDAEQLPEVALRDSEQRRRWLVPQAAECLTRLASLRREVNQLDTPVVLRRAPLHVSTLLQVVDHTRHPRRVYFHAPGERAHGAGWHGGQCHQEMALDGGQAKLAEALPPALLLSLEALKQEAPLLSGQLRFLSGHLDHSGDLSGSQRQRRGGVAPCLGDRLLRWFGTAESALLAVSIGRDMALRHPLAKQRVEIGVDA